jgi:hypothetical protein
MNMRRSKIRRSKILRPQSRPPIERVSWKGNSDLESVSAVPVEEYSSGLFTSEELFGD